MLVVDCECVAVAKGIKEVLGCISVSFDVTDIDLCRTHTIEIDAPSNSLRLRPLARRYIATGSNYCSAEYNLETSSSPT